MKETEKGTQIEFSVPKWAKKIVITFESFSGPEIELKDVDGVETSRYLCKAKDE